MNSELQRARVLFDDQFYARTYPSVAESTSDLANEYFVEGWKLGRNPSSSFDTRYYLRSNPDVAAVGICPLVHYANMGVFEGRRPFGGKEGNETARGIIKQSKPPREWVAALRRNAINPTSGAESLLSEALSRAQAVGRAGLIVSASHDDYVVVLGGVQSCVQYEEIAFRNLGWTYVHLSPAQALPILSDFTSSDDFLVSVRVNSRRIGIIKFSAFLNAVAGERSAFDRNYLIVHHLLGFFPELFVEAVTSLNPDKALVWIHDYFTLCPNPHLLRNNVAFCHAPPLNSLSCDICCYGGERRSHVARVERMFRVLQPVVLAPSKAALEFWLGQHTLPYREAVVTPHGRLVQTSSNIAEERKTLRIAHLGAPTFHKGWHVFEALAEKFSEGEKYEFFHLGYPESGTNINITFGAVSMKDEGRTAMIDAILRNRIDVVVNWSMCYETFSFTTYEALAAGAFVVARKSAGNVWAAVAENDDKQGCAVEDENELFELFSDESLFALTRRRNTYDFIIGGVSRDYLVGNDGHG